MANLAGSAAGDSAVTRPLRLGRLAGAPPAVLVRGGREGPVDKPSRLREGAPAGGGALENPAGGDAVGTGVRKLGTICLQKYVQVNGW